MMSPLRLIAISMLVLLAAPQAIHAQSTDGNNLPVTRCDAATNSCSEQATGFTAPVLGPSGRTTVLSPSRRTTEGSLEGSAEHVSVPGCALIAAGTMVCETIYEFQHCRTLMISSMVDSCRIEQAFASGYIEPRAAAPGSFALTVESSARVMIKRDSRGFGQARGSAVVELNLNLPEESAPPGRCLQRDQYLYFATGPKAGIPEIEDTEPCDTPLTFSFRAHDDDLMRAWNLCDTFSAWGGELEDSIEILAAGIFHVRSAAPDFAARYPGGAATIARYVTVKAPLTIDCRG
jgi:hypothetical protein